MLCDPCTEYQPLPSPLREAPRFYIKKFHQRNSASAGGTGSGGGERASEKVVTNMSEILVLRVALSVPLISAAQDCFGSAMGR